MKLFSKFSQSIGPLFNTSLTCKSTHSSADINSLVQRRNLTIETLQSRDLFYAPLLTPTDTPEPPTSDTAPPENTEYTENQSATESQNSNSDTLIPPLFPQGVPFQGSRYSPTPQGLFPDGSVRTISPEISPRVFSQMTQHGTAPIPSTLHRTGVGYGVPSSTLAGMDPKLRELTTMKENWDKAYGALTQCTQKIEIAPENADVDIDTIYSWMENFRLFNEGNIATVEVYKPGPFEFPLPQGESYAVFTVNTLDLSGGEDPYWEMLNSLQLLINDRDIAVKLYSNPEQHQLAAVTLENHMLVGVRVWRVYESTTGWICIETETKEQRNGYLNNLAAQMAARSAMEEVWHRYLDNLGHAATGGTGRYAQLPSRWIQYSDGTPNPWKDVTQIPGPTLPSNEGFPILDTTR